MLSSCFSYKNVDIKNDKISLGKKYKLSTNNENFGKVRIIAFRDNVIVFTKSRKQIETELSNIESIKRRKFSILKSASIPIATLTGLYILAASTFTPEIGALNFEW